MINVEAFIKEPPEIPKGQKGWKVRRDERVLLARLARATTPQDGWALYQKTKRELHIDGDRISEILFDLQKRGYVALVGHTADGDPMYARR